MIIHNVFKHLKNAKDPLKLALNIFQSNGESLHEKQKEYLLEAINNLSQNISLLSESVVNSPKLDPEV